MSIPPLPAERWQRLSGLLGRLRSGAGYLPRDNDTLGSNPPPAAPTGSTARDRPFRVLILRSSPLADVEASLTHQVLFDQVRRHAPLAEIDLAFYPPRSDQAVLESAGLPWPLGVRSLWGPAEFDLVLLNVSYVLELLNLPRILAGAGLPLWSSERDGSHPVVILGGSSSLAAQAVVRHGADRTDSLVDALFFGEIEDSCHSLLEAAGAFRQDGTADRQSMLRMLSGVAGCWVPGMAGPSGVIRKAVSPAAGDFGGHVAYPVLNGEEAGTCRIQISLGCPFSCSFCFEGHERKPYRDRPAGGLEQAAAGLRRLTGARSLDVVSFNFNTHHELPQLMTVLQRDFRHVHFMSQRLDILNRTKFLLENVLAADKRSFTLGIEGISGRFRRYYAKGLADTDLHHVIQRLLQAKVKEIKCFFIISGLEGAADQEEFARLTAFLQQQRRLYHPGCRLIASFGVLCRMPFTPLQYSPLFLDAATFDPILAACRTACVGAGVEFRTAFSIQDYQAAQILCLGDADSHGLLMELHHAGCDFQGSLPAQSAQVLKRAIARLPPGLVAEKAADWSFPLEFVDIGFPPQSLHESYVACRACLEPGSIPANPPTTQRPGTDLRPLLGRLLAEKNRAPWCSWLVRVPEGVAGAVPDWLDGWLGRAAFDLLGGTGLVLEAELDQRFRGGGWLPSAWHGLAVMRTSSLAIGELVSALSDCVGRRSANGMELLGPWDDSRPINRLGLRISLPLALEPATRGWNQLLPGLGLAATLRKAPGRADFLFPAKQAGKRSVFSLGLSADDQGTVMECELGPKAALPDWLAALWGKEPAPFLRAGIEHFGI